MIKKRYEPPTVKKVRLVAKNATLGNCHSSPNLTPRLATSCRITPSGCWYAPNP